MFISENSDCNSSENVVYSYKICCSSVYSTFPTLAALLARTYLSVQATSAPSERIFSKDSRIISKICTKLDHQVAGKLLFVSENIDWYDKQVENMQAADIIDVED